MSDVYWRQFSFTTPPQPPTCRWGWCTSSFLSVWEKEQENRSRQPLLLTFQEQKDISVFKASHQGGEDSSVAGGGCLVFCSRFRFAHRPVRNSCTCLCQCWKDMGAPEVAAGQPLLTGNLEGGLAFFPVSLGTPLPPTSLAYFKGPHGCQSQQPRLLRNFSKRASMIQDDDSFSFDCWVLVTVTASWSCCEIKGVIN